MFPFWNIFLTGIIVAPLKEFSRLISTFSLNALVLLNSGFNIYPTWDWFKKTFFVDYNLICHMQKRQTMMCTQQMSQWNWLVNSHFPDFLVFMSSFCASLIFHQLTLYLSMYTEWYYFGNVFTLKFLKCPHFFWIFHVFFFFVR